MSETPCHQILFSPCVFFFNDTATTEIYTLSLHDALPISFFASLQPPNNSTRAGAALRRSGDRKSTRLNSRHVRNSYAAFCLKKKNSADDSSLCSEKNMRSQFICMRLYPS